MEVINGKDASGGRTIEHPVTPQPTVPAQQSGEDGADGGGGERTEGAVE